MDFWNTFGPLEAHPKGGYEVFGVRRYFHTGTLPRSSPAKLIPLGLSISRAGSLTTIPGVGAPASGSRKETCIGRVKRGSWLAQPTAFSNPEVSLKARVNSNAE